MQQSIEVLLLPIMDLDAAIQQELQDNPLLEVDESRSNEENTQANEELKEKLDQLFDASNLSHFKFSLDDEIVEEKPIKCVETLEEKLLNQLRIEFNNSLNIKIGEIIIGNINEDGYLTVTCEEIAQMVEIEDLTLIEHVLGIIQSFDPIGIASRNLKECLLIQAKEKLNGGKALACRVIDSCLDELGQKKYTAISRKLGISMDKVKDASRLIAKLDPKPARNFRPIDTHIYIKPDLSIKKTDDNSYQLTHNRDGLPILRVSPMYRSLLKDINLKPDEKRYINEKLQNALQFIKSIDQRGRTLEEIAAYILKKQRAFFEDGHMFLVPMSLKDVAQALNRNESTISRAIANKYIDTPQGLFPLKFFFSYGVGADENKQKAHVSNRSFKEEIKYLVENEDKSNPLSDQDIQKYFEEKDMKVARRTIAKYRLALKILPSHLRKQ